MKLHIVNNIDESACLEFLCKYGKGELTDSMNRFIDQSDGNLHTKYEMWIKWINQNDINFGGTVKNYNTILGHKTIIEYEWGTLGSWAELFDYLYNIKNNFL